MDLEQLFSQHLDRDEGALPFDKQRFPAHGGVYAFADDQGRIIQLSSTQNLRRAVGFRLYPPTDDTARPRTDLLAITRRVWWEPTHSQFESFLKFHSLASALFPDRYRKMCAFGPSWFAVINRNDRFPRWLASDNPFTGKSACLGPFATRRYCELLVKDLEDLFSLCRYHAILQETPHGEACAYAEMGRCPAPCDGTISFSQYRQMLDNSIDFALGRQRPLCSLLEKQMSAASADLEFEKAGRAKQDLERAATVADLLRRIGGSVDDFRYLIIQRGGGRTKVKAFFVNQGEVTSSEPVAIKNLDQSVGPWLQQMEQPAGAGRPTDPQAAERIWLVSHFLYKRDRTPGLYLPARNLPKPDALVEQIRRAFAPQRPNGPPAG